jgi:hypothetical protein
MFLFYKDNKFYIDVKFTDYDKDEFDNIVNTFRQLYLKYTSAWEVEEKRIDEILLWLEKFNIKIIIQDSAKIKIEQIKNSYSREVETYRNRVFDPSILNKNVQLTQYQIDSINWKLQRNVYLDGWDAGTGKTWMNAYVVGWLFHNKLIDGIIIVTPIGLEYNFLSQTLELLNIFAEDDFVVITNKIKKKPFSNYTDKKIIICPNHLIADILLSYKEQKTKVKSKKNIRWTSSYVDICEEWNKTNLAIIIDESHEIKNSKAIRTKSITSLKNQFKYRFLLSATPAINKFSDFYTQLNFLDKSIIPMSENAFKIYIANYLGNQWDKYAVISYNTEKVAEVQNNMRFVFTRKLKEDLEEFKTKVVRDIIYFKLTETQIKIYQQLVEEELYILQEEFDSITWKLVLSKLQMLCTVFDNTSLLKKRKFRNEDINTLLSKWSLEDDPKFIALKSKLNLYIDDFDEKVIIFDHRPETLNELARLFSKYNPVLIHGGIDVVKDKSKDRQEKQDKFNYDKKCKLALLSSLTSSRGGNWNKDCHRIITNSCPFDSMQLEQLSNRTDRVDSKQNTQLEIFCYNKSLDLVRVNRSLNRIDLNDRLGKEITQEELGRLLKGIV